MAEDWAADVKKYVPQADDTIIAGIVRYCGIALRTRDASLVSFTDPVETGRVRDNFCRKKLGLTDSDATIDAAIARVGERMGGDPTRNRVTVYYLLAEAFGKLGLFGTAAAAAEPAAPAAHPEAFATPAPPPMEASVPAAPPQSFAAPAPAAPPQPYVAPAPAAPPIAPARAVTARDDGGIGGVALATLGGLAVIVIGAGAIATMVGTRSAPVPVAAPATFAAPAAPVADTPAVPVVAAAAEPVVPQGSGVTAQVLEGKPSVSVYFDTAKTDVSPDFATVAAPVKAWVDGHPGARLAVSGFNDPRGNAAFNAELSKNRAKKVRAALTTLGVPAGSIDLVKPPETTDAGTTAAQARRVDITVRDAS